MRLVLAGGSAALALVITALVLSSGASAQLDPNPPEQVHLTLDAANDALIAHWSVDEEYRGVVPQVLWSSSTQGNGDDEVAITGIVSASIVGVLADAAGDVTIIYGGSIGPLEPGERISYLVGADGAGYAGPFEARMVPGPDDEMVILSYGDVGADGYDTQGLQEEGEDSAPIRVRDVAIAQDADLLALVGDYAYSGLNERVYDHPTTLDGHGWNPFMRMVEPLWSTVPVMPAVGNHERGRVTVGPVSTYDQVTERFVLPGDEMNYGYRAGPAYLISVNSHEHLCPRTIQALHTQPCIDAGRYGGTNEELVAWLDAELTTAEGSGAHWTIVYFHHAPYSFGPHGDDEAVKGILMPVIDAHEVDLVLSAHDHLYERSLPMLSGEVTRRGQHHVDQGDGVIHVVTGGGGRKLYDFEEDKPRWVAAHAKKHHITRIELSPDQMRIEAVDATPGSENEVFDWVVVHADGSVGSAGALLPLMVLPAGAIGLRRALAFRRG